MDIPEAVTLIAKNAIEAYLTNKESRFSLPVATPHYLLKNSAGVFVSIYDKDNELRGRIGTYQPTQSSIALEIVANAISVVKNDRRFKALELSELVDSLVVVDIISSLKKTDSFSDLDPEKYGVFIQKDEKRAIVLPDMEEITSVEKQIQLVLKRADLDDYYGADIFRFETVRCFEKLSK